MMNYETYIETKSIERSKEAAKSSHSFLTKESKDWILPLTVHAHNNKFQERREKPKQYLDKAIALLGESKSKLVVEIGGMRGGLTHDLDDCSWPCCNDGHSSLLLARTGCEFYSVDISESVCNCTRGEIDRYGFSETSRVVNADGIDFLKNFSKRIDLLFLDGWDIGTFEYAEGHLNAYLASRSNLTNGSLILIDDTDVDYDENGMLYFIEGGNSGKGRLLIPRLIEDGCEIIFSERQTLLRVR